MLGWFLSLFGITVSGPVGWVLSLLGLTVGFPMSPLSWLLSWLGFTATGPAAGSIAAAWQARIGNVVAGSVFALLQSFAMGVIGVLQLLEKLFGL